jgi:predicted ATPase
MRRGGELLRDQKVTLFDGLVRLKLSRVESAISGAGHALLTIDGALKASAQTGHRSFDAELHRARGKILLKAGPGDCGPGEEAFQTAIVIAQQQGARSFELRAALSLAKLYQSTGRPAEAHAILAPALEGFSPTSEMPEIAEAQALLEPRTLGPWRRRCGRYGRPTG